MTTIINGISLKYSLMTFITFQARLMHICARRAVVIMATGKLIGCIFEKVVCSGGHYVFSLDIY